MSRIIDDFLTAVLVTLILFVVIGSNKPKIQVSNPDNQLIHQLSPGI